MFFYFLLQAKTTLFCNGYIWNGTVSDCYRPPGDPEKQCDFHDGNLCGWSQLDTLFDDLDWQVVKSVDGPVNATVGTGVTKTIPNHDHYLFFESSDSFLNASAILFSPVYPPEFASGSSCFVFNFNMNGMNMGSLSLYLVPENTRSLHGYTSLISLNGDQVNCLVFLIFRLT
jgi:hypothetical protein